MVNTNSTLIVNLQDDSGINISGYGVGNALVAYLDDEPEAYILNDYYKAYMNDFTRGSVHFPMKGLSPGRRWITVKAGIHTITPVAGYLNLWLPMVKIS